ncbi:hypothetical protein BpHYR1_006020 [Brachionus plicatilis]|uniref:Uncharacterized protein n=1 Tax=Brachionus plicatilis TaxID=10195 RepID=A0A3M7QQ99_BRAPC|nr:hypothetical protein BpHYR1_006020 [Brachionus plicatilis]
MLSKQDDFIKIIKKQNQYSKTNLHYIYVADVTHFKHNENVSSSFRFCVKKFLEMNDGFKLEEEILQSNKDYSSPNSLKKILMQKQYLITKT